MAYISPMKNGHPLYNAKQAAKALGISLRTFHRWKAAKKLKLRPVGKLKRYRPSDVLKILVK
jgi:predicted site-specific integrase-resolvase